MKHRCLKTTGLKTTGLKTTGSKTMDELRIKALYRRHTEADRALDADALHEALGRHGFPDEEGTAIDRIAASAVQADVLRLVMELGPDAEQLSRDVTALRKPRHRVLPFLRSGFAVAAGVGAFAVLFSLMQNGPLRGGMQRDAAMHEAMPVSQSIMSGSFEHGSESHQQRVDIKDAAPIFSGDFDS